MKPPYNDLFTLFELSVDMLCVTSATNILSMNPAFVSLHGYTEEEIRSRSMMSFIHPEDIASLEQVLGRLSQGEAIVQFEARSVLANGESRWVQWSSRADAKTGRIYASGRDITNSRMDAERLQRYADLLEKTQRELKEAIEELTRTANTDQLTGLLNRRAFEARAVEELSRTKRTGQPMGLALFDVDFFKNINDTYGHPFGDVVLREVARRLDAARRPYDILARWGGEEFVAVFPDSSPGESTAAAERLALAVGARPIVIGRVPISVRVSGGVVSTAGAESTDHAALVASADNALRRAKENGRDRVETGRLADAAR